MSAYIRVGLSTLSVSNADYVTKVDILRCQGQIFPPSINSDHITLTTFTVLSTFSFWSIIPCLNMFLCDLVAVLQQYENTVLEQSKLWQVVTPLIVNLGRHTDGPPMLFEVSVKGTQAWNFFFDFFGRNRKLMVPRACNTRFLKIVFDSAEIFDF